jgi:diguanylate cyclase (GGDEF)-like protein
MHRPHRFRALARATRDPRNQAMALFAALTGGHVRSHAEEQRALRRLATAVAAEKPLEEVFRVAAQEAATLAGARLGLVTLVDDAGSEVVAGAWPESARSLPAEVVGANVSVPVMVDGRRWGSVSAVGGGAGGFVPDARERLVRAAELVELAIVNAEARRLLAEQASSDPLTGLVNHRVFHERLQEEAARAQRHDRPLALAVFDLDHFKRVNDTHGHQTGDWVLREVAGRLAVHVRSGDVLGRVGGEEFAWLMPETDDLAAFGVAERARASVATLELGEVGRLTVSAGVSDLSRAVSAIELYRFADEALYLAKSHGRDVTFRYSPEVAASAEAMRSGNEPRAALAALEILAHAVDARDPQERRHSESVAKLAEQIALAAGWTAPAARSLRQAALLHDLGKIGATEDVLLKPGPLSGDERERIALHVELGERMAAGVLSDLQLSWIRGHHERWDGGGYPDGLAGDQIPEGACLICIADAWDAMTSPRRYASQLSPEEALEEVRRNVGHQFSPLAVEALCQVVLAGDGMTSPDPR